MRELEAWPGFEAIVMSCIVVSLVISGLDSPQEYPEKSLGYKATECRAHSCAAMFEGK